MWFLRLKRLKNDCDLLKGVNMVIIYCSLKLWKKNNGFVISNFCVDLENWVDYMIDMVFLDILK